MKNIALFGATGKAGSQFLKQALAKGYRVKALVRTPEKITHLHPNLEIIKGDVLHEADVYKTVAGTDLVVSLFGHVKGSPEWLQTNGTENIIKAMEQEGIGKIISLSGGGLPAPEDQPKFPDKMIRFIMKIVVPKILNDAERHAEVLRKSNLDWIIVRGPRLKEMDKKGSYKVGWVGTTGGTVISYADLADFILQQVESDQFTGKMPFVSY
ncbi:MAG: NAD(P)-dependent oxidoreductase [Saprospiraceae bacterium]